MRVFRMDLEILKEVKMSEEKPEPVKGILQSKTMTNLAGLLTLFGGSIYTYATGQAPAIELWLMDIIPGADYDFLANHVIVIGLSFLALWTGKGVYQGRVDANPNLKGLWKKP